VNDGGAIFLGTSPRHHPVAHRWQFAAADRMVLQASRGGRLDLAAVDVQAIEVVELDGDSRRLVAAARRPRLKSGRPLLIPPEILQTHAVSLQFAA
jgi:hypothetical protein